ncbi:MAG: murein L,D-transpeptidase catalytic domain family protein [Bdellovibrio sp.]
MQTDAKTLFSRFRTLILLFPFLTLVACGTGASDIALPDDPEDEPVSAIAENNDFTAPLLSDVAEISSEDRAEILSHYDYVDSGNVVPYQALQEALVYFHKNKTLFGNQKYVSVINFGQSSKEKRFYIINMETGAVWSLHVAHGKGSDANHDGWADVFSNISGSNASSIGVYRAAETYYGSHGLSLRLDGLSTTNSKARSRAIVIHGASYVQEANVIQGRSWGCPAVSMDNIASVVNYLKGGSMIYAVVDKGGTQAPIISNPNGQTYSMQDLSWENSQHPEREQWSQYLMKLLLNDWSSLLSGATDMKDFCPRYASLTNEQRANVWAQLFSAMTKYESNYSPVARMRETTMGTDPVTKKPVYSEGLLQLSYQDITGWKFCQFDWSRDKNLSATDPKKTILDPYINLHCGVGIMAKQVARTGKIKIGSGAYWAVIKTNSKYQKISAITSMVKALPLCQ